MKVDRCVHFLFNRLFAPGLGKTRVLDDLRYLLLILRGMKTTGHVDSDNRVHAHIKRRFLPPSDSLEVLDMHKVADEDRLDNIAFDYFSDPILLWRSCDANDAMKPDDVLLPIDGRPKRLRITLPQGVSGVIQ